ncbi:MAG: polymer-forming cytoskeletal protein [Pseudomonadota bacterium]|nr:polymer-forming cytoskeletal protein [Pseudomonadota bacterium]
MALQGPFFGKRESEPTPARPTGALGAGLAAASPAPAPSMQPFGNAAAAPVAGAGADSGAKLTVGPNIKLKGVEITDCDTLVVEGTVEATMDSRVIQIAEAGAFKGSAEIDIAEVRGTFDGTLTVREKLVIFSTGKVTGTIRYGKIVIEEGGQLSGDITFGTAPANSKPKAAASTPAPASAKSEPASLTS